MAKATTPTKVSTLKLPSDTEIRIDRTFNASRELVWRAWTDAKLLPRWMGPAKYEMTTSQMDVRPGGKYRWVWDVDGQELVIHGEFVEVEKPRRLVTKEFMEPHPDPTHNVATFTETGGRTTVALLITAVNKEARDGMLASGMKDGMDEGYVRLDALVKDLE